MVRWLLSKRGYGMDRIASQSDEALIGGAIASGCVNLPQPNLFSAPYDPTRLVHLLQPIASARQMPRFHFSGCARLDALAELSEKRLIQLRGALDMLDIERITALLRARLSPKTNRDGSKRFTVEIVSGYFANLSESKITVRHRNRPNEGRVSWPSWEWRCERRSPWHAICSAPPEKMFSKALNRGDP